MKQCGLSLPKRRKKSATRAQRNRTVSGNGCDFEADFVLMRDEHYRIAIWSKLENEVSFVVSACERWRPPGKCGFDCFTNLALVARNCWNIGQRLEQVGDTVCSGGPLWPP